MAVNRLTDQFGPGEETTQEFPPKGFESVPASGILGWTQLSTEQRALYEFAFRLAQAQYANEQENEE